MLSKKYKTVQAKDIDKKNIYVNLVNQKQKDLHYYSYEIVRHIFLC